MKSCTKFYRKHLFLLNLMMSTVILSACSSLPKPPASPATPKVDKSGFIDTVKQKLGLGASKPDAITQIQTLQEKMYSQTTKKSISISIRSLANANADYKNKGMAVVMTVYPLSAMDEIDQLGLEQPSNNNASSLNTAAGTPQPLLEQVIIPNKLSIIKPNLPPETAYIGLVFQMRQQTYRWKLAIPINAVDDNGVIIQVGGCDVRLVSGVKNMSSDPVLLRQNKPLIDCKSGK